MKLFSIAALLLLNTTILQAQSSLNDVDWPTLIHNEEYEKADSLFAHFLQNGSEADRIEAHIGFANLFYSKAQSILLEGNDFEGGMLRPAGIGKFVDSALVHLDKGLSLDPQDLSMHQGRMHITLDAGRYFSADSVLRLSIQQYNSPDEIEIWLSYTSYFYEAGQIRAGLDYLHTLEEYFPDEHRVIANIGAFYMMQENDEQSLLYARRGVEMNPEDPLNNWNLGRLYDYMEMVDSAKKYYEIALELEPDGNRKNNFYCFYAEFLETDLGKTEEAQKMRDAYCDKGN